MIKLNKHGLISKRLIAPEFTVGNTFVEGGGTPEELAVLSLTNEQLAALSYIVNGEGRIIPVSDDGTFDTKIGHSYCIRHTDDLILHEAWLSNDENLYVKRYGSGQLLFFATSEKCKINDPSYIVTEVFRMAALNDFVDWSGIEHYQKWFREIEVELTELLGSRDKFVLEIADEITLVAHTDRVSEELLAAVKAVAEAAMPATVTLVQYNHNIEISWRDINKYAACVTKADMLAVNPDYGTDLTSDGEWVYLLDSFKGNQGNELFNFNTKIKKINIELPAMENGYSLFRNAINLEKCIVRCPVATGLVNFTISCDNLTFLEIYAPNLDSAQYGFGHRYNPSMKLTHFRFLSQTKLSNAEMAWENTILDKDSILNIIENIPTWSSGTHKLDLGIHVDYQNDEAVAAAISEAEMKGWAVTVKWNGTPTSSASTMEMGQLIYAKVGERELPDGTAEQYLDWGHYVTNPEGYETFRSLESAYEYFGLENPETK